MSSAAAAGPPSVGATALGARSLAPDLARGAMLLLIALANAHVYLHARDIGVRSYPIPESVVDQVVILVQMMFVDGRAYPMFAFLFGYGLIQLYRRTTRQGVDEETVLGLIRRRGGWLILFGFLHALLLFSGDILGAYGVLAVLLAGLLIRASDRKLLVMVALWTVPVLVFGALQGLPAPPGAQSFLPSFSITDPLSAALVRVAEWAGLTVFLSIFVLVPALLLGVWAARRRLLDDPERYRPQLRWVAVLGLGLAAAGGLPLALMAAGWWPGELTYQAGMVAGAAHAVSGYAGGVGYAALAGLIAIRVQSGSPGGSAARPPGRPGAVVTALTACGQRSLTCYLLQSVVFVAVLASYGGGLGSRIGLAVTAVLATATWVLTVLIAEYMRRRNLRGPAEVVLRRLTYGPPSRQQTY